MQLSGATWKLVEARLNPVAEGVPRAVRELLNMWAEIQSLTTHVLCHPADEAVVREALEDWGAPSAASPFVKVVVSVHGKRGEILVLQPGEMVGGPGGMRAVDRKTSPMMN